MWSELGGNDDGWWRPPGYCPCPFKKYKSMILMGFHRTLKWIISTVRIEVFVLTRKPTDLLHTCELNLELSHLNSHYVSFWVTFRLKSHKIISPSLWSVWTVTWRGTQTPYLSGCGLYEQWLWCETKTPYYECLQSIWTVTWRGTQAPYCKCLWSVWTVTLPWNSSSLL